MPTSIKFKMDEEVEPADPVRRFHFRRIRIIQRHIDIDPVLRPPETDQLFLAVKRDAFRDFRCLAKVRSVNRTNARGYSLLDYVIKCRRVEMFDYLMTLDNLEIDYLDSCGESALLYSVNCSSNKHFILELIKKGADVHLKGNKGETVLHKLVSRPVEDRMEVGQLFIERGVDVNAQDNNDETALHKACKTGNVDWIYMLLYYGALATIPSNQKILPVAILSTQIPQEDRLQVEDVLFYCTFDFCTDSVQLASLVQTMLVDSMLFTRIVDVISDIKFEMDELEQFSDLLSDLQPKHLELFMSKFSNVVLEMMENYPPLARLVDDFVCYPTRNVQEILQLILKSDLIFNFVQSCNLSGLTIGKIIHHKFTPDLLNKPDIETEDEEIIKIIYILLSYGLEIKSCDLDTVYLYNGYCELFRVLLHMDLKILEKSECKCKIARLYYDPSTKIEFFCNEKAVSVKLLCYYNHPKLKEVCLKECVDEEVVAKARTLPTVPCLVELSRNASRHYIISRYNIKNSMWFYTILQSLPIGEITRKIIALETELY